MASENITKVEVKEEFQKCPLCGYKQGFHVSFIPGSEGGELRLVLLCPSCETRYDVGKSLK